MTLRSLAAVLLIAVPLVQPMAAPAFAQNAAGLTLAQVQRKYPNMSTIFIQKCDHNADGLYSRGEMACVQGIYQSMYIDR